MTDRHAAYMVVLTESVRADDAERLVDALTMVKGVMTVTPVPSSPDTAIAELRRDNVWRQALYDLARNGPGDHQ